MRRLLLIGVAAVIALVATGAWAANGMDLPHRLSHDESLGTARLQAPSLLQWPRLDDRDARARCDICQERGPQTVEYAWLVGDESLTDFSTNVPNHPQSPADVPLPRMVWVLEWPDRCWNGPPVVSRCTTYELIDDSKGWVLYASQHFEP